VLLPGRTAGQRKLRSILLFFGVGLGQFPLAVLLPLLGCPPALLILLSFVMIVGSLGYLVIEWRKSDLHNLDEMAHGYTTWVLKSGSLAVGRRSRAWRRSNEETTWDYSGVWVLNHTGQKVLSEPDPTVEPPGLYPSPHREGWLELWSGAQWLGIFRDGAEMGLEPPGMTRL